MTKYLVVGASGLVGSHIYNQLKEAGKDVVGTFFSYQPGGLLYYNLLKKHNSLDMDYPDIVFVPASMTSVNYCEIREELSYATNVLGLEKIINNFPTAHIVYFSTGYVFDGIDKVQNEHHVINPLNVYGLHKTFAEHTLMSRCFNHYTIIRTMFVYGVEKQEKNFVYQVINKSPENIGTYTDQYGNPTYAPKLAKMAIDLANARINGIFHVGGNTSLSKYQWAAMICDVMGLDKSKLLRKTSPDNITRPKNATVNNTLLNYYDSVEDGLEDMKKRLNE